MLREGDRIVLCGLDGPIATNVRALLTPQPLREMRVKSAYVHHKQIKAAIGVKLVAPDLEKAVAGGRLLIVGPDDDEEDMMELFMGELTDLMSNIDKSGLFLLYLLLGKGVCVQASTLGSLEALLAFLKSSKIPVSGINIGPCIKRISYELQSCLNVRESMLRFLHLMLLSTRMRKKWLSRWEVRLMV